MTNLILEKRGFPPNSSYSNGVGPSSAPLNGLLWAAATVGYPQHAAHYWRGYGAFHVLARLASILGGLESRSGRLTPTIAYSQLESSERAWHTYSIAMATARWIAAQEFGIAWLQHLEQFLRPVQFLGRQRPDLIGPKSSGWCVVEAKGRQRGNLSAPLAAGKKQVASVQLVNGTTPTLALSIVTKLATKGVRTVVLDPPPDEGPRSVPDGSRARRIETTADTYLRAYYRDVVQLIRETSEFSPDSVRRDDTSILAFLPTVNVWIGLRTSLYVALRAPETLSFERVIDIVGDAQADVAARSYVESPFVGLDGVVLVADGVLTEVWS
jgi:hypothetical protein